MGCAPKPNAFRQWREKDEPHRRNKQRDWKMDQHHMLCVLGQKCGLKIERIYHVGTSSRLAEYPYMPTKLTPEGSSLPTSNASACYQRAKASHCPCRPLQLCLWRSK